MKRFVLLFITLSLTAISCKDKKTDDRLITQQRLQDSIQAMLISKDQEVENLFRDLSSIEQSLTAANVKYGNLKAIEDTIKEVSPSKREVISKQISAINEILRQNKEKIEDLTQQLSSANDTHREAINFINNLNSKIDQQALQIELLTKELAQKNIIIDNLNANMTSLVTQNEKKDEQIIGIENERNAVYYIIGSRSELLKKNIISKQGGFIGIGRRITTSANSDLSQYIKTDARKLSELPLKGKKITLLTTHPSNSYSIEGKKSSPISLKITDKELFWSKSKFLVIVY
jgi:hypothetical protein